MSRRSKLICIISIAIFGWTIAAPFAAECLIVEAPLVKADAILVLAGSSVYVERTQKAAALFKQGIAPKILLTDDGEKAGWSKSEERNPPFVDLARNELLAQGVPADSIEILKPKVSGTFYESEALREAVIADDLKSVLIVTSAFHTRRALWTFKKDFRNNNIDVLLGIEAAMSGQQTPTSFTWWLSPRGWQIVGGEYVKMLYYWLFY